VMPSCSNDKSEKQVWQKIKDFVDNRKLNEIDLQLSSAERKYAHEVADKVWYKRM
jgi:hypothetical protein